MKPVELAKRLGIQLWMQCPGCFVVALLEDKRPDGWVECDTCGEKWTVIDLRDGPDRMLSVDRGCLESHPSSNLRLLAEEVAQAAKSAKTLEGDLQDGGDAEKREAEYFEGKAAAFREVLERIHRAEREAPKPSSNDQEGEP